MSVDPNYEFVEPVPSLNPAGSYVLQGREISTGSGVTILLLPVHSRDSIMSDLNSLPPERRSGILKVGEWRGMMFVVTRPDDAAAKHPPGPLTPKVLSRAGVWKIPPSGGATSVSEAVPPPPPPPPVPAPISRPGEISGFTPLPSAEGPGEFTRLFQSPVRAPEPASPPVDRSPRVEEVTLTSAPEAAGEFTEMFPTSPRPSQPDTSIEPPARVSPGPTSAEPGEFTRLFLRSPVEPPAEIPVPQLASEPPPPPPPPPPARTAPAVEAPKISIEGRDGVRRLISLDKLRLVLGRSQTVELSYPDDDRLSPEHLSFTRAGDEWSVEDLGSENGSFLNGRVLSQRTPFHPGDRLFAGWLTISFPALPKEVETVPAVPEPLPPPPPPPPPANPAGEFTRLFQSPASTNTNAAVQTPTPSPPESVPPGGFTQPAPPVPPRVQAQTAPLPAPVAAPPPPPPASDPGEFTRMFQPPPRPSSRESFPAVPPPPPRPTTAPAPPPPPPASDPGEFTRMFQSPTRPLPNEAPPAAPPPPPRPTTAPAPPPPPPASDPGEFTRMFQSPTRPLPSEPTPVPAPPVPARPTTAPAPGEFTRIMESPMAPPAFRPGALPSPSAYVPPPPVPPKQQGGEFTRMFGVGNSGPGSFTPEPPPPPPGPDGMGATRAFSVPQQAPYSASQGPSEFTRMFNVPSPEPSAPKPSAPAVKATVVAPAAGPNPKLLIITLAVFAVLAVAIVVFFALRK